MQKGLAVLLLVASLSLSAEADDRERFERLEHSIRQQVTCLDLVEGNFDSERQKHVTRKIFETLVAEIREYVKLGQAIGIQDLVMIREYVGSDDILIGVFLGAMLSDDAGLQQEKDELGQDHGPEELQRLLWQKYGCDTAYANL